MDDAERRKAFRRKTQVLREETRAIKAKTQTIKDATEALREAFLRARPTSRVGIDDETGEVIFSVIWASPTDAQTFLTLMRDVCAAAGQPMVVAYCDELLSRLPAARH